MGDEFQVNTYTTGSQYNPAVAFAPNGDFMVVWDSGGSSGTDSNQSIQGQRFASDGSILGGEIQVNTYTTANQGAPEIASSDLGFVVVWQSDGSSGTDASSRSIQGQRYGSDGSVLGGEFQVNTYTTGFQSSPAVAAAANGDFVVVWQDSSDVRAQRFASDGMTVGAEFVVVSYTTNVQDEASVAMDDSGNFVVVWESDGSPGTDSTGRSIQGQRFAADGSSLGGQVQVNTFTTSSQTNPSVAGNGTGDFVVVWQSDGSSGDDSLSQSIQGQRYGSDGSAVGGELQINNYTTESQVRPAVALDAQGNFTVAWESGNSFGPNSPDGDDTSIQARRFAADGSAFADEFQVNSYTTSVQRLPSVAVDESHIVMIWPTYAAPAGESGTGLRGQLYTLEADLSITQDDGVDAADPGGTLTYIIVASNAGPDPATDVIVTDDFPADLACSWMSLVAGGATGNSSSSGDLLDTLTMPVGSTVTYTATCNIDSEANATLVNTATITSPISDPDPSNNSARDITAVPPDLFTDGFESGSVSAWSNSVQ